MAVLVHGGFWRARYDLRLHDGLVADLAARGWAVWNLEYRRLGWRSRGGWPATFDVVPIAIARRYAEHAAEAGDPCELVELPGCGHIEHLDPASDAWRAVIAWLDGFRRPRPRSGAAVEGGRSR